MGRDNRSRGRRTKLTDAVTRQIEEMIGERGLFRRDAAALIDIDEGTLSRWYKRGAEPDAPGVYRRFHLAVNRAEASFAATGHDMLRAASATNPRVLQWMLSRRFPHHYGRKDNAPEPVNANDEAERNAALRKLFMEKLDRLLPETAPPSADTDAGADPEEEAGEE